MKEGLYFRHIRSLEKGAVTLAIEIQGGWVQYSYALCSPKDQFRKATGREIALLRLLSDSQRRVSGFQLQGNQFKGVRDVLQSVERNFCEDVRTGAKWIIACGWLRRSVQTKDKARTHRLALQVTRKMLMGQELNRNRDESSSHL